MSIFLSHFYLYPFTLYHLHSPNSPFAIRFVARPHPSSNNHAPLHQVTTIQRSGLPSLSTSLTLKIFKSSKSCSIWQRHRFCWSLRRVRCCEMHGILLLNVWALHPTLSLPRAYLLLLLFFFILSNKHSKCISNSLSSPFLWYSLCISFYSWICSTLSWIWLSHQQAWSCWPLHGQPSLSPMHVRGSTIPSTVKICMTRWS